MERCERKELLRKGAFQARLIFEKFLEYIICLFFDRFGKTFVLVIFRYFFSFEKFFDC